MKKFLLTLILVLSFSCSAFGFDVTIGTSESFITVSHNESDDTYIVEADTFDSLKDALDFAASPNSYLAKNLGSNYSVEDESAYQDLVIAFDNPELGGAITLSSYSLNSITINGGGRTLTTSNERDLTLDNSSITFTINSLTINGEGSTGGIQINAINSATFNSVNFRNITSTGSNGGAISISGGNNISFERCRFVSNSSTNGGAIYIEGGSGITFNACTFSSNSASSGGGAIYIAGGSNLTFTGANTFSGNSASDRGGAVAVSSVAPDFSGISFEGTNSASRGGCVYVVGGASFSNNTSFATGSADMGGALYIASGKVTIDENVSFTGNTAENGGTIYIAGGNVTIDPSFSSVAASNGGTLYISGGTVNINGSIEGDKSTVTAENGGAIYISSGTANINGSISGNYASNAGGAIYMAGGTVNIASATDIGENCAVYGGAVYITGSGSRFNVTSSESVTFDANYSEIGGGAIYVTSSASSSVLSFTPEVIFSENYVSNGNGGALWLGACAQLPTGTITFEKNQAQRTDSTDDTLGNGGAVYIADSTSSSVTLGSSHNYTFSENTAYVYGGAFYTLSSDVIFDGLTMEDQNTANVGGGFASSGSGRFTIRNGSTISNQIAPKGGAIYAMGRLTITESNFNANTASEYGGAVYGEGEITVTDSTFSDNICNGTENNQGGGAIYASGSMTISGSTFSGNSANQEGGAICGNDNDVTITDSYFTGNLTENGNGGAIMLANASTLKVSQSTFTNNESGYDGGAFYAQGRTLDIDTCYFEENQSTKRGGAVYFDQSSGTASDAHFSIMTSMLRYNSAAGESGGGLHIATNTASIRRCTFDNNVVSGTGYGGGVYLNTTVIGESESNTIENCTFTNNSIIRGGASNSGGGGLAVECEDTVMKFCTFTMNDSAYKGGGIYVIGGKLTISGTIAVGNTDSGVYDIWVDDTIDSDGYNRIGVYGQGSGVTDFSSVTRNDSDVTGYPSKNWSKTTFFTDEELAVNEISDTVPPKIGSTIPGQERLMTLMLKEEETLETAYRATNIIPYSARSRFPNIDERGVSRIISSSVNLDVGAVFFDGTRTDGGDDENDSYTILKIQMSGVPNEIRQVGQTATLLSKVYYTNGRTAFGGSEEGEEAVTWSSSKPSIVSIDEETGVIKALRVNQGSSYVIITVKTVRTDSTGEQATDTRRIKVTDGEAGWENVSPSVNAEVTRYITEMMREFSEYNIGYDLAVSNKVYSAEFQSSYEKIWNSSASLGTVDPEDSTTFTHSELYESSDGFKASKPSALNVNYNNEETDSSVISLKFVFDYTGDEIKAILGHEISASKLDSEFAEELFKVLRIEFQGSNGSYNVIGGDSKISASEAYSCGALKFERIDSGKGLRIILDSVIADADAEGTLESKVSSSDSEKKPQIISGVLVVPDGVKDGSVYGSMWIAEKDSSKLTEGKSESEKSSEIKDSATEKTTGSGGSGCNSLNLSLALGVLILSMRLKKNHR